MENNNEQINDKLINLSNPTAEATQLITHLGARNVAFKIPHQRIEQIKPLGNNPVLTDYLKGLGIWDIANESLREVYYFTQDEKQNKKNYFGIGWQNDGGDWEVRNKYYVCCLGNRKMTYILANPNCLVVFEFYFDYLTWKRYYPGSTHSIIVLNTLDTLNRAIALSKEYALVQLYFNRQESGRLATRTFIAAAPHVTDRSVEYEKYATYNDKLIAQLHAYPKHEPQHDSSPSRGKRR